MRTSHLQSQASPSTRWRGFTLVEVLVAMGIFAVAMASLSSMFLVAVRLQQTTLTELQAQQARENFYAVLQVRGISPTTLPAADDLTLQSFSGWAAEDLTFPGTITDPAARPFKYEIWYRQKVDGDEATGPSNFQVILALFAQAEAADQSGKLLHKSALSSTITADDVVFNFNNVDNSGATPQLIVDIGDQVIDEYGRIFTVTEVEAVASDGTGGTFVKVDRAITKVWKPVTAGGSMVYPTAIYHGKPRVPGRSNPLERVTVVEGVVR